MDFLTGGGAAGEAHPEYCRAVEAYLCRKNDGHLIRIVGPAFERVCDWAGRGVPLKVVYRGIDRYFERYYAKGPRRRPVRIEYCEADVLDVFDEWRRAVGVLVARERRAGEDEAASVEAASPAHGRRSLHAHLERIAARLIALGGDPEPAVPPDAIARVLRDVQTLRDAGRVLRGDARQAAVARLSQLDVELIDTALAYMDPAALEDVRGEAAEELAPFRGRMPQEAYTRATEACVARIVRERTRLPVLAFE